MSRIMRIMITIATVLGITLALLPILITCAHADEVGGTYAPMKSSEMRLTSIKHGTTYQGGIVAVGGREYNRDPDPFIQGVMLSHEIWCEGGGSQTPPGWTLYGSETKTRRR